VSVTGTVVELRYVNPHVVLIVEGTTTDGRSGKWAFEGLAPGALSRNVKDVKEKLGAGTQLRISGWAAKDAAARAFSGSEITFSDGSRMIFGSVTPGASDVWHCSADPCPYRYPAVPLSVPLAGQNPLPEPRFDVVSIKPRTTPLTSVPPSPPGALRRLNVTVQALILYAYQISDYQLIDLPGWGSADRFDVEGKAEGATRADLPARTRVMLRERFGLQAHHEERQMPTYLLVVANPNGKLGPNIKPNADDCKANVSSPANAPAGSVRVAGCSDADAIAASAARAMGGPVANRTGLAGKFEYSMFYSPVGDPVFGRDVTATTPDSGAPHYSTALQEQLGLKLERSQGTVDVLVIDHIERPSEN